MKVTVLVRPRDGILDPQGQAIDRSLQGLGYASRGVRAGKVFLDWSQNNGSKTTIAPYSMRGRPEPTVAAPRSWPGRSWWRSGSCTEASWPRRSTFPSSR